MPNFFQERTKPLQSAHCQNATIPAAPRMAMMGVALNMKRAAFQAMNVAAKTQTPNTKAVPLRWRRPPQQTATHDEGEQEGDGAEEANS